MATFTSHTRFLLHLHRTHLHHRTYQFRNAPPIHRTQHTYTHTPRKPTRLKLPPTLSLFVAVSGLIYYAATFHISPQPKTLNPQTFTAYTLASKTPVATSPPSHTTIFSLRPVHPPGQQLPSTEGILSVQIKQPQLQIARSYSPLPSNTGEEDDGALRFLVKLEPGGEVTRYLFSLGVEDKVFLRGPTVEYIFPPAGEVDKTLFIAGGTGIAPALQLAANSLAPETEIFWAVRSRAETGGAMAEEVGRLVRKAGGKVSVRVFVDEEGGIGVHDVERGMEGGKVAVVVSGPEGFIKWVAGEKVWRGGREEQGKLGGMVRKVLEKRGGEVTVFKL
ncbi:unnamed protein product [Tuber melanosporum]|uniref:(Perigord truffle) hypothetical protein n=1 Tax=Tuber melanosporum (strain Mel28) TaxID=656061 RepID=D5GD78_TUBMM|nr:uncharacterized protein GSTUM_00006082001 [Tuber melanosporum]CAZ82471.1 unnamed protein product [Tuber melanosporum]